MKILRSIVILMLVAPSVWAQEGKVIVVNSASRDAKRTAYRLHITLEQLKGVRSALQEATDLAKELDTVAAPQLGDLAGSWIDLNRPKAAATIAGLIEQIRKAAASATELKQYQNSVDRAQVLIWALANLDPDEAIRLARDWPAPPSAAGAAGDKARNRLEDQSRSQIIRQLAWRDPQKALALADESGSASSAVYAARGQQITRMAREGRKYDALQMADQWIADFKQYQADPGAVQDYLMFLRQLAPLDPNRFLAGLAAVAGPLSSSFSASAPMLFAGDQNVPITRDEYRFLTLWRYPQQPELMLKIIALLPGLKAKADQAGGIDRLLTARPAMGLGAARTGAGIRPSSATEERTLDPQSLFDELRGKAEKNPGLVRRRLSEIAQDPRQISTLIDLAERAREEDPELGSMALDAAKPLLPNVKSLPERDSLFQRLVVAYRHCDGDEPVARRFRSGCPNARRDQESGFRRTSRPIGAG